MHCSLAGNLVLLKEQFVLHSRKLGSGTTAAFEVTGKREVRAVWST